MDGYLFEVELVEPSKKYQEIATTSPTIITNTIKYHLDN